MVDPDTLDKAILRMKSQKNIQCLNLTSSIKDWGVFTNQDVIKTTVGLNDRIFYFSRQPIPTQTEQDFKGAVKQIGIYLIHKELLLQFAGWDETPLEQTEKIDMLRIMEHGYPIYSFDSKDMVSVDTPEELYLVERILLNDPLYRQLFAT